MNSWYWKLEAITSKLEFKVPSGGKDTAFDLFLELKMIADRVFSDGQSSDFTQMWFTQK